MTGILCALAGASGGGIVSSFTAWNVSDVYSPGTARAKLTFYSDGHVLGVGTPGDNTIAGSPNWYLPTTTAIGASYYVRFTPTSGTLSAGNANVWTSLSTDQVWEVSTLAVTKTCVGTISIATDSGGSNIVFTSTGNTLSANTL